MGASLHVFDCRKSCTPSPASQERSHVFPQAGRRKKSYRRSLTPSRPSSWLPGRVRGECGALRGGAPAWFLAAVAPGARTVKVWTALVSSSSSRPPRTDAPSRRGCASTCRPRAARSGHQHRLPEFLACFRLLQRFEWLNRQRARSVAGLGPIGDCESGARTAEAPAKRRCATAGLSRRDAKM
ncbi:hypothetical protein ACVWZV_009741 [Bradyrhizobium sp. GM5.1]